MARRAPARRARHRRREAGRGAVRFGALDQPVVAGAPDFAKSLSIDHARDGEVMLAFGMNGEQMPLLNGFPVRLIVPGLVFDLLGQDAERHRGAAAPDDGYWMAKAYKIRRHPARTCGPGQKDFPTVPINTMIPRSWMTSLDDGQAIAFDRVDPAGRHCDGRRLRRRQGRCVDRRRQDLVQDDARPGSRQVQLPPLGCAACRSRTRVPTR